MARVCISHGTWQLVMLSAALREVESRGVSLTQPTHLLLIEGDEVPELRRGMEVLAPILRDWASVRWVHDFIPLKPPQDEWPICLETWTARIRENLGVQDVDELWLNQYTDFPQKLLLEAFPDAEVIVYEEGLMTYTPHHISHPMWRRVLANIPQLPALAFRRKLQAHFQSLRLCDWRLDRNFLRRIRYLVTFLVPPLRPAFPYNQFRRESIHVDTLRQTVKGAADGVRKILSTGSKENTEKANVLMLGSAYYLRHRISADDEARIYVQPIRQLLDLGYHVRWKNHPRDREKRVWRWLSQEMTGPQFDACEEPGWVPAEVLCELRPFVGAIAAISTSLFYLPRLFGLRAHTLVERLPDLVRRGGDTWVAEIIADHIAPFEEIVTR